jgi:hypothetical protein
MKTKSFNIHNNLISAAIVDLITWNEKVTKQSILNHINDKLYYAVEHGDINSSGFKAWGERTESIREFGFSPEEKEKFRKYYNKYKNK